MQGAMENFIQIIHYPNKTQKQYIEIYKTTKIVCTHWLAERGVCTRVWHQDIFAFCALMSKLFQVSAPVRNQDF